jgi:uncharacterized protein (DUF4415 family)
MIKSDLKRIDAMTDETIDYSDIPPLTDEQLAAMKPLREIIPEVTRKVRITIRLDADVVRWFKEQVEAVGGGNYQPLINAALREHIERQKESLEALLRRVIREELRVPERG